MNSISRCRRAHKKDLAERHLALPIRGPSQRLRRATLLKQNARLVEDLLRELRLMDPEEEQKDLEK